MNPASVPICSSPNDSTSDGGNWSAYAVRSTWSSSPGAMSSIMAPNAASDAETTTAPRSRCSPS
ncbi:hypothetical protein ACFQFH_12940 [Halobaculum halobium]|uniref:hypothetical protein n=1 Tax=Halobaculum halobium TaxID=3032281 RepID=UPI00361A6795